MGTNYIRFFSEIRMADLPAVGGKNASLGEMVQTLAPAGVRIPNGFAITASAYRHVLDEAKAWNALRRVFFGLRPDEATSLAEGARRARQIVYEAGIPEDLRSEILAAYAKLRAEYGPSLTLAVRSSATAEDLPEASFAGQQDSYLNVRGEEALIDSCRRCFASLFTDRAIHYRAEHGFDHLKTGLSIGVMKMVRSDLASSGVMFSLDTESGFRDVVFITGTWGLGEPLVQGLVDPDEFYVFKPAFQAGHRTVLSRRLGGKAQKMVYAEADAAAGGTAMVATTAREQARFCLTDEDVLTLADYALAIEAHYSQEAGQDRPMDMEWAKDGIDGKLYMVQARPETVVSRKTGQVIEQYHLEHPGTPLVTGRAVGSKVASGKARVIEEASQLGRFVPGEVLVAETTSPDWEPIMKQAAAIVTDRGGRTCHAAIIARELGIPAVVGTGQATGILKAGQTVTVSCAEGDTGKVYGGALPFTLERTDLRTLPRPATQILLNLGNPALAFQFSQLPNDGVGLARMEFIISSAIKIHPMALLHPERIADERERQAIAELVQGYGKPADFFIERLSEGIGTIAAAFHPKPVVVRMSDFKSNEYASLLGGRAFEPEEANPMLGFRGASRYDHPAYREGFALECAAIRRVREEMGLGNVIPMIPFVRRVVEADQVLRRMAELGLERGKAGLAIYAMCEIPNNVILIDQFAQRFDGFSIGGNDLTQLTLGVDRDSETVAFDFDERDPGVKEMIRQAVAGCRRHGIHSGFCGQAPSDFPEMAEFLVELGIHSMSLNPDTILATTIQVLKVEERLGRKPAPA